MVVFEFLIHSSLNLVSGLMLLAIGLIILLRNFKSRNNQLLFCFFAFLGLFEIFDAFTIGLRSDPSLSFLNIVKDFSVIFLILSLSFGFLAVLTIYYGDVSVFQLKYLIFWLAFTILIIVLAVIGDNIPESSFMAMQGFYMTVLIERSTIGLIGINGALLVFSALILLYLTKLYLNS